MTAHEHVCAACGATTRERMAEVLTGPTTEAQSAAAMILMAWVDAYDPTAYDCARALGRAGLLRPSPRVWRAGDPEPGDVWAVLDREGEVHPREVDGPRTYWGSDGYWWRDLLDFAGPLVEVHLPEPVTS